MQGTVKTVGVGIIGLGTVGGGVARLIQKHADEYLRAYGISIRIARACALERERANELGLDDAFTPDWREVVNDPAVDIVVEVIGGEHPATEIFLESFAAGKHVVSANKALLGRQIERLENAARDAGVQLRCEASCGGGIPIINALEHALVGNDVLTIAGIVNGTTNYILSRMDAEGLGFEEVLADAQRLGYAEADPTADVDGFDAASKLAILSSIAFHSRIVTDDVFMQGIRSISALDIQFARETGRKIKLLAIGRKTDDGICARVHPAMIPATHQLANVDGAMNAIFVVGDAVGETMFYGAGAGAFPTASAIVGDVLELARPLARGKHPSAQEKPYERILDVVPIDSNESRFYLRIPASDSILLEKATSVFENEGIALEEICMRDDDVSAAIVATTLPISEAAMSRTVSLLAALDGAAGEPVVIRIEDVDIWREGVEAN